MLTASIEVKNKLGLHARAANKLVEITNRYACDIGIQHQGHGEAVNAKSIMSVMLLAAPKGSVLDVSADGHDEEEALTSIKAIFDDLFGEGE